MQCVISVFVEWWLVLSVIRHVWICAALTFSKQSILVFIFLFTYALFFLGMHRKIHAYNAVAVL